MEVGHSTGLAEEGLVEWEVDTAAAAESGEITSPPPLNLAEPVRLPHKRRRRPEPMERSGLITPLDAAMGEEEEEATILVER